MLSSLTSLTNPVASYANEPAGPEFTPGDLRTLATFALFSVLFAWEARRAHRQHAPASIRQSYFANLGSFLLNDAVMSLLAVSSLWFVAERHADRGLLSGFSHPVAKTLGSLLLLDLALYGWHRISHQVDALWWLHKVHHSDQCMNVTTAFRLHGGELVLTTLVKAAFIVLMGIDSTIMLASETVITLMVMFHHANIAFCGERWLGRFFIVPSLHRTHHSTKRSEHDRNYGAVFSLWDRIFGTFTAVEPETLGLPRVPGQSLLELVKFGLSQAVPARPQALQAMIAEAAYFRAEHRGFTPGREVEDWMEAEQEILRRKRLLPLGLLHASSGWKTTIPFVFDRLRETLLKATSLLPFRSADVIAFIRCVGRSRAGRTSLRLVRSGTNLPLRAARTGLSATRLCTQD